MTATTNASTIEGVKLVEYAAVDSVDSVGVKVSVDDCKPDDPSLNTTSTPNSGTFELIVLPVIDTTTLLIVAPE